MKYTYFFKNPENGLTKIGKSSNPTRRFYALAARKTLHAICLLEGDLENHFHNTFSDFRVSGEWFNLPCVVIESIKSEPSNILKLNDDGSPDMPGIRYDEVSIDLEMAEQVKAARKLSGLTQSEFAKLVGFSLSAIQKFESGRRTPPRRALPSILQPQKP